MRKKRNEIDSKKNSNLTIFKNEKFGQVRSVIVNDTPYFVGKDIALALGYKDTSDALKKHVHDDDKLIRRFADSGQNRNMIVINESGLYSMIFGSKLDSAIEFKHWVTSDVLPTIRKTGGYVDNDDLFINTYLPFADDQTKMLFSTTLATVRKQNEIIESQKNEIVHKQEVINGLTDDVDINKKKDVINRICRRRSGNYANRYKELYKCFKENFHIDLEARCEGYNMKQTKKKDQLSVIKYAEQFGYIDNLYSCCTKLFEAEIDEVLDQINTIHS